MIGRLALDERVTALRALGLVIGFTGVLTIILAGNSSSGEDVVIGAALTLLGAIGYGSAGLLDALPLADRRAVRHHRPHGRAVPLRRHLPASPTCSSPATSEPATGARAELWWSIAFIVIGAQVIAYLTFYVALSRWPSSRVYPWTFLSPVVAILIEAIRGNLPGARADGRHGDRRGRAGRRQPARRGGVPPVPAVAPSRSLDLDVAEHARLGEPVDVRIRVAALRHQHLARVLAAPGCRAQLGEAPVDAQR